MQRGGKTVVYFRWAQNGMLMTVVESHVRLKP